MSLVKLDAGPLSPLRWPEPQKDVFYILDFGPLGDEEHLMPMKLAIDHFAKHMWQEGGVGLYSGTPLLSPHERGFLRALAAFLPEKIEPFVLLDCRTLNTPSLLFRFCAPDLFPHMQVAVWGDANHLGVWSWNQEGLCPPSENRSTVGLLLPVEKGWGEVDRIASQLLPYRALPESTLTHNWDGLDQLVVISQGVTPQVRRKLLGFCAAEGTIITVGEPLGLPNEIPFEVFVKGSRKETQRRKDAEESPATSAKADVCI